MTLSADEFIHRSLLHVLPDGFHRIRHCGLFASGTRAAAIATIRALLAPASSPDRADPPPARGGQPAPAACPRCSGRLLIVERFRRGGPPRLRPIRAVGIDPS